MIWQDLSPSPIFWAVLTFPFPKALFPFCCLQQTAGSIPCSGKISAATFQEELLFSLPFWLLAVLQRFYTSWDFFRLGPNLCTCPFFDSSCPEGGSCDTIFQKKSSFFGFSPPFLTCRIYGIISCYAGFPDFLVSNFFYNRKVRFHGRQAAGPHSKFLHHCPH